MIIAVDFDGTLHTGKWPGLGAPAPYARDVMTRLHQDGHYLIIWSCREGVRQTEMVNWLLEYGIPFDRVNDNHTDGIAAYEGNSRKVYAHLYVDDKQVGGLPTWEEIYEFVREKEAEYKKYRFMEARALWRVKVGKDFNDINKNRDVDVE